MDPPLRPHAKGTKGLSSDGDKEYVLSEVIIIGIEVPWDMKLDMKHAPYLSTSVSINTYEEISMANPKDSQQK